MAKQFFVYTMAIARGNEYPGEYRYRWAEAPLPPTLQIQSVTKVNLNAG
jgi:hypothetical protein